MSAPTPFEALGEQQGVLAIATAFYDAMERDEPELTALHECPTPGRVSADTRHRFGLFLVGWVGGPQEYMERYGHPRLRRRHAAVPVTIAMRDAWLRCMQTALDGCGVTGPVRDFLDTNFAKVADFLRNRPD